MKKNRKFGEKTGLLEADSLIKVSQGKKSLKVLKMRSEAIRQVPLQIGKHATLDDAQLSSDETRKYRHCLIDINGSSHAAQ